MKSAGKIYKIGNFKLVEEFIYNTKRSVSIYHNGELVTDKRIEFSEPNFLYYIKNKYCPYSVPRYDSQVIDDKKLEQLACEIRRNQEILNKCKEHNNNYFTESFQILSAELRADKNLFIKTIEAKFFLHNYGIKTYTRDELRTNLTKELSENVRA